MLSLADQHAQSAQVDLALVEADMLDLTGLGQFQTITCFADSLCYLNDLAQVNAALTQAGQHLAPGGKFLFDVITPTKPIRFTRVTPLITKTRITPGPSCGKALPTKRWLTASFTT